MESIKKNLTEEKQRLETALQRVRDDLEKQEAQEREQRLEPLKDLAILAHTTLCQYNHCDGCGWDYETDKGHNWSGWSHARWLKRIDELVNPTEKGWDPIAPEKLRRILTVIAELRQEMPDVVFLLRHRLTSGL